MARWVLIKDKNGNDVLAKDLRTPRSSSMSLEAGATVALFFFQNQYISYFISPSILSIFGVTYEHWMGLIGAVVITYILGLLNAFVRFFSVVMGVSTGIFIYHLISHNNLIITLVCSLLAGILSMKLNNLTSFMGDPIKFIIKEMRHSWVKARHLPFFLSYPLCLYRYFKARSLFLRREPQRIKYLHKKIKQIGFVSGVDRFWSDYNTEQKNYIKRFNRQ